MGSKPLEGSSMNNRDDLNYFFKLIFTPQSNKFLIRLSFFLHHSILQLFFAKYFQFLVTKDKTLSKFSKDL